MLLPSIARRGTRPLLSARPSARTISIISPSPLSTRRPRSPCTMASLTKRGSSSKPPTPHHHSSSAHDHSHDGHDHGHSHSIFHSHTHDHSEGAEQLITALSSGRLDRGTRITLLGLGSNVLLTAGKGLAGLVMNSASLLAEAAHSLSDLLGLCDTSDMENIQTAPIRNVPMGFETFGTLSVSVILVGGAIGIGLHSYHLLLQTLLPFIETLPPSSSLHTVAQYLPQGVPSPLLNMFHSHGPSAIPHDHSHGDAVNALAGVHEHGPTALLNPHAAWFALASVVIKEWLYRITNRVAVEEHSPVLKANALHHRADALTSGVALASILGSSFGGWTFLDPVGGLVVSAFVLQQGLSLSKVALYELLDAGMDQGTKTKIEDMVLEIVDGEQLLGVQDVRGVKSGGQLHLDLSILVKPEMTVRDSHDVEQRVRELIKGRMKQVFEVQIHVHCDDSAEGTGNSGCL